MHILPTAAVIGGALLLAPHASAQAMYSKNSPVLQVNYKNWNKLIVDSHIPSVVEFYAPWCGHCKSLKPAYEKAAASLKGIVQIAAMDCDVDENKALCSAQGVQGFPTIKTVRTTGKNGKPIIVPYQGGRDAKSIADAAKALLPNYVKRVEDKDLAAWLADSNDTAKAILFSDKGKTSAQLKAIANDFYGEMSVAQIRDSNDDAIATFGVDDYPSLVVLPGGSKEAVKYDGEMTKEDMTKFLLGFAKIRSDKASGSGSGKSKDSSAKSSKASKSADKVINSQKSAEASEAARSAASETLEDPDVESPQPTMDDVPKPVKVAHEVKPLPTLATEAELKDTCLGPKAGTCLLALLAPEDAGAEVGEGPTAAVANLAQLQQNLHIGEQHIFPFYVVPASNEYSATVKKALGLQEDGTELMTVNGKRKWWRHYDADKGFEIASVGDWVDAIKMGDVKKQKLPADILGADQGKLADDDKSEL